MNNGKVEAVRFDNWKLVLPHRYRIVIEPGKDGRPGIQNNNGAEIELSLFDMKKDPSETTNIAKQHNETVLNLTQLADSLQKSFQTK